MIIEIEKVLKTNVFTPEALQEWKKYTLLQTQFLLNSIELKEKCGNKIMLIPLTIDLDLIVVDSILQQYKITQYPSIVIDEKTVLQGITSENELQDILRC